MDTSSDSEPSLLKTAITTKAIVHAELSRMNTLVLDEISIVRDTTPPKEVPVLPDVDTVPVLPDVNADIVKLSSAVVQKASKREQSSNKKNADFLFPWENNNMFDYGKKQRKLMSLQDVANLTKGKNRLSHNYDTRSNTSDISGIYKRPTIDCSSDEDYLPKKRKSKVKPAKTRKRKLPVADVQDDVHRRRISISDEEVTEELYIEREQPRITSNKDLDLLSLTPPERKSPPKKKLSLDEIVITSPRIYNTTSVGQVGNNYSFGNKDTNGKVFTGSKLGEKQVSKVPTMARLSEINEGNLSPKLEKYLERTPINRPERSPISPHEEVIKRFVDFLNKNLPKIIRICPNEIRQIKESLNKEDF